MVDGSSEVLKQVVCPCVHRHAQRMKGTTGRRWTFHQGPARCGLHGPCEVQRCSLCPPAGSTPAAFLVRQRQTGTLVPRCFETGDCRATCVSVDAATLPQRHREGGSARCAKRETAPSHARDDAGSGLNGAIELADEGGAGRGQTPNPSQSPSVMTTCQGWLPLLVRSVTTVTAASASHHDWGTLSPATDGVRAGPGLAVRNANPPPPPSTVRAYGLTEHSRTTGGHPPTPTDTFCV